MTNSERASYIRGLMDGLELDPTAKETKVLNAMVELLDDLCLSVEELEDGFAELSEQVDEIDEVLGNVEEDFYELEGGCSCHHHHHHEGLDDGAEFEVTCPSCGDIIELTDDLLEEGSIVCPGCGETLEFDLTTTRTNAAAAATTAKRTGNNPRHNAIICL